MKRFYTDRRGLSQDDSTPTKKTQGLKMMKMEVMEIVRYDLYSLQISAQSKTYGRFSSQIHHANGKSSSKNIHSLDIHPTWASWKSWELYEILLGERDKRGKEQRNPPLLIIPTVKRGGGSIILHLSYTEPFGCFSD